MESLNTGDHVLMSAYGLESLARLDPAAAKAVCQNGNEGVVSDITADSVVVYFGDYRLRIKGKYLEELPKILTKIRLEATPPSLQDRESDPDSPPSPPLGPPQMVPVFVQACQWTIFQFLAYKGGMGRPRVPVMGGDLYDAEDLKTLDEQEKLLYHTALKKFRTWLDPNSEHALGERTPSHGRISPP